MKTKCKICKDIFEAPEKDYTHCEECFENIQTLELYCIYNKDHKRAMKKLIKCKQQITNKPLSDCKNLVIADLKLRKEIAESISRKVSK